MRWYEAYVEFEHDRPHHPHVIRVDFPMSEDSPVSVWDAVRVAADRRLASFVFPTKYSKLIGLRLRRQDLFPDHVSSHGWLVGPPDPYIPVWNGDRERPIEI